MSSTSIFARQLLLKSLTLQKEDGLLPAVTCTVTFRGVGQEKEVLLPYLKSLKVLRYGPYTHVQLLHKAFISFYTISPCTFNTYYFEEDLIFEHWPQLLVQKTCLHIETLTSKG